MTSDYNRQQILRSYFKHNSLVDHQLNSFNDFLNFHLPKLIENSRFQAKNVKTRMMTTVSFSNVVITKPEILVDNQQSTLLYPKNARDYNLTYGVNVYADVLQEQYNPVKDESFSFEYKRSKMCHIPVMIGSSHCNLFNTTEKQRVELGECASDIGGYFIINGVERVLTSQVQANYATVYVLYKKNLTEKYKYVCEIRSMSTETGHSALVQAMITRKDERGIYFCLPTPHVKDPIPVGIIFKALGYVENEEIEDLISAEELDPKYIRYIHRDAEFIKTKEDAIKFISKYVNSKIPVEDREKTAEQLVENEMFPHLGSSASVKEKAVFVGYMINKLLRTCMGKRLPDDRDNYTNKRVQSAGNLCFTLFRTAFKRFLMLMQMDIENHEQTRKIDVLIAKTTLITKNIHTCFSTGNWGIQRSGGYTVMGVSQLLDRMTYKATLSHLRRVIFSIGKEGKSAEIRRFHFSQYGFICPYETPEGKKAGSVMNLAMTTGISKHCEPAVIKEILAKFPNIETTEETEDFSQTRIFINGVLFGFTDKPKKTVKIFNDLKIKGLIDSDVSIVYDCVRCEKGDNDIKIFTDEGRLIRPVFALKKNKFMFDIFDSKNWNWEFLVKSGNIVFIDNSIQENSVIAMDPSFLNIQKNDYCEIHPYAMMSIVAGAIPYVEHCQSPRICYESSMSKQALGVAVLNQHFRSDTTMYQLQYAQRPIVSTIIADEVKLNEMPSCINAVVAVAMYGGCNAEDSLIISKQSIEMGMWDVLKTFTITVEAKKHKAYIEEKICVPPETKRGSFFRINGNFNKLDANGLPIKGVEYLKNDVLVGKISVENRKNEEPVIVDMSYTIPFNSEGKVERVDVFNTPSGNKIIKITMCKLRHLQIGDKLASCTAQKGTIGAIIPMQDMPFTSEGIVPDIIINPLAFPSRMTTNMLIEMVQNKLCAIRGEYGDCSSFTDASVNVAYKICEQMSNTKYERHGRQYMTCGKTGELIDAHIFIGIAPYQRLKHQVDDKAHARATGSSVSLTRQSTEGRGNQGGLRFGEMERDSMIAHGTPNILTDRLLYNSDFYQAQVCSDCGHFVNSVKECNVCNGDKIARVNIPYAAKLLFQELIALGINPLMQIRKNIKGLDGLEHIHETISGLGL